MRERYDKGLRNRHSSSEEEEEEEEKKRHGKKGKDPKTDGKKGKRKYKKLEEKRTVDRAKVSAADKSK
jgi:hypothetical protein